MADKTGIQWTNATWNPVRGCSRVSTGCGGAHHEGGCYAEKIAARFSGPGQPFHGFAERTPHGGRWTGKLELVPAALDLPLRWRTPRLIFANSMSDLFHEALTSEEIATVFAIGVAAVHLRGHRLQILTKRAERMHEIMKSEKFWDQVNAEAGAHVMEGSDPLNRRTDDARATLDDYGPDNPPPGIWLGVSVEDQAAADVRIPCLLETPAAVRFISAEPLLGPIDLMVVNARRNEAGEIASFTQALPEPNWPKNYIDWVIVGGESGPRSRPFDLNWARSIVAQCKAAGVPVFVKQLGSCPVDRSLVIEGDAPAVSFRDRKGGDIAEFPEDLRVREFPS